MQRQDLFRKRRGGAESTPKPTKAKAKKNGKGEKTPKPKTPKKVEKPDPTKVLAPSETENTDEV